MNSSNSLIVGFFIPCEAWNINLKSQKINFSDEILSMDVDHFEGWLNFTSFKTLVSSLTNKMYFKNYSKIQKLTYISVELYENYSMPNPSAAWNRHRRIGQISFQLQILKKNLWWILNSVDWCQIFHGFVDCRKRFFNL